MSPGIGLMDRRLKTEKDAISLAKSGILKKYKTELKKIDNIEQLPTTISASLKEKVDSDEVSNFYSFVEQNSFDFDISNLTKHISDYFYFGGMLSDIELDVSQVENFLNIHEKDFALLASEFLKKIN